MSFVYKQIVDNKEEVFRLTQCSVNLGIRVTIEDIEEEVVTSDEEFLYLDLNSESEDYDSEDNGFLRVVEEFFDSCGQKIPDWCQGFTRFEDNSCGTTRKMQRKRTKSLPQTRSSLRTDPKLKNTPEEVVPIPPEPEPMFDQSFELDCREADQTLLADDFYETNMEYFMSQSIAPTQTSAMIQQIGRFSYIKSRRTGKNCLTSSEDKRHIAGILLKPLVDLFNEDNHWPLVLKTLQHSMFVFSKSSKVAKTLAHRIISHYNWSEDKVNCLPQELPLYHYLHNDFIRKFMTDCLLNSDYSRTDILEVIGGSEGETNAWPFISKLITFLVNQSILKGQDLALAMNHFELIIDVLVADFKQFLNESDNYCADIRGQNKPLICRLIWSNKSPDYLNSVFKQIIYLIVKVFKISNTELLIQMFRLFDLGAECLRMASGNVRPFVTFSLDKPTPTTELFQQLKHESMATKEVIEKLMISSTIPWITLQFCGLFLTNFIVDLKTKYLLEKHRQISLKLVVESLTNARLMSTNCAKTTPFKQTDDKTVKPISDSKRTSRRRQSLELVSNPKQSKVSSKRNKYGENGLHIASKKGDIDKLIKLLNDSAHGFGPDPNEKDNAGYTPLCTAAHHQRIDFIRALIEWQNLSNKRLDFEAGPDKHTALHEAIENNAIDCAKLIIESGGPELMDIRRKFDNLTPRDLIKTEEMREMIGSVETQFKNKSYRPKIAITCNEDSQLFIKIMTHLISSYVQTTRLTKFIEFNDSDAEIDQDMWPQIFSEQFMRDISDTDISFLIQELSVFRKLPTIAEQLRKLFDSMASEEMDDLVWILDMMFKKNK